MSSVSPNLSRFNLSISGLNDRHARNTSLTVLSFHSLVTSRWTETSDSKSPFYWANRCGQHGLSEHYAFELEVQTKCWLKPENLLAQAACLQCDDSIFHGYLSSVTCLPTAPSGHRYRLVLSSPLYPLTQHKSPKVFIDKAVPEIIEECLSFYNWKKGQQAHYYFDLQDDYPPLSCWIQYAEHDWDHLDRLLRKHGLFFYFVQTPEQATLIFRDRLNGDKPFSLSFNQADQSLFHLQSLGQVLRDTTVYSAYNPDAPSEPWVASQQTAKISEPPSGIMHTHGHADSEAQNAYLARVRQQSIDWQRTITLASTTLSGLQPGQAICISGYPIAHFNQTYLIVDIEHQGNQSAAHLGKRTTKEAAEPSNYRNHVVLMPATMPFRKYDGYAPRIQAPLSARLESAQADPVESAQADDAAIDETGHYRFRYPFDTSNKNPIGMASPKTRFTQLMGTAGQDFAGMHFPSRHGTEVEVVFLHGNINCPVIVGALSTPAVVNQHNPYQALVRTAQGHEWCLDDTPGHEAIRLSTPDQQETLALNANPKAMGITLKTTQGAMRLTAAQDIHWETMDTLSIKASDYEALIRDHYHVKAGARIDWETGGHFFLKAEFIQCSGSELSINSAQNMVMQTGSFNSKPNEIPGSTLTFSADHALHLESTDIQLRARDTLKLENAGAKIVFENGNIRLTSPCEIEFIGDSVQFIGPQQRG